jgi:hypothetical protein
VGSGDIHLSVLLDVVELSEILKIKFHKTSWGSIGVELSSQNIGLSIVLVVVESVVSLDHHGSHVVGVLDS